MAQNTKEAPQNLRIFEILRKAALEAGATSSQAVEASISASTQAIKTDITKNPA